MATKTGAVTLINFNTVTTVGGAYNGMKIIYPKKIMVLLFCILVVPNIGFFLALKNNYKPLEISMLAVFLIISISLILLDFIFNRVFIQGELLIINADTNKGFRKYRIPLANIQKIECIKIKWRSAYCHLLF
ncbi:MAG: hypothetical protein ACM3NJ_00640 [Methanobacterium sp.]